MTQSYEKAIEDLKREITDRMRMVNDLLRLNGQEPIYADPNAASTTGSVKIRPDQFYTYGLSTAVREFLNMRKAIGPATLDEIYAALVRGSFRFDAEEANAKPALKQSLTKNTAIFHRLPNGTYGLAEWYPNRKNADDEARVEKKRRSPKRGRRSKKVGSGHVETNDPIADPDRPTSLAEAVKQAVRSMKGEFTKQDVLNWIAQRYPDSKASERRVSIFSLIGSLHDELSLMVVKKGVGRQPYVYRVANGENGQNKQVRPQPERATA